MPEGAVDTDEEIGLPDESGKEYLGINDALEIVLYKSPM
jgi:hypothetical protein